MSFCPEPWQAWHTGQPPREAFGDAPRYPAFGDDLESETTRVYWTEHHWECPVLYDADMWYANELLRLEDRGPA